MCQAKLKTKSEKLKKVLPLRGEAKNTLTSMNRIKELLQAKGMSQTELAHRLGKCFNTVILYSANKVQPPVAVLYRIADNLEVDVRELLVASKVSVDK